MLKLLKEWADYHKKAKFEKAEAIELKMTQILNEKYEELVVPTKFYCTFLEGAGQKKALELGHLQCDDKEIILKKAKSPSDIIWLNRGLSKGKQRFRFCISALIVFMSIYVLQVLFFVEL